MGQVDPLAHREDQMRTSNIISYALAGTILASATPAFSQPTANDDTAESNRAATEEPSQPGAPAAQSSQATPQEGLHDIVVTAQRTASTAQRTPVALTVYTGDDLASAGVTNVL